MVGFEKALTAVKVIKDQIQYRSQSLFNLARGYFSETKKNSASYKTHHAPTEKIVSFSETSRT